MVFQRGHRTNVGRKYATSRNDKIAFSKIGNKFGQGNKGKKRTRAQRERLRAAHQGQIPWNKGKTGYKINRAPNTQAGVTTRFKSGALHPNYKGGKTEYGLTKGEWKALRLNVLRRDGFACQSKFLLVEHHGRLDVHHINPYRYSRDNSEENLITLCAKCHMIVEQKRGSHCGKKD